MTDPRIGDTFKPGDLLNNTYRIEAILGRGGTSEVYKARNEISNRFVAIKALKSEFSGDEGFLTLLRREEEIREIRHDAVVRYSENHRTTDGHIYLVMDYVEGPGLDVVLQQGGMGASDLVAVCRRVAEGLQLAHARRIVHRDLSPDNIILRGGIPHEAVIIDFGIAKDTNPGAQTIVGNEFAGKYAYAAPEQLSGDTDARSDLYALGALLLATFRGRPPDIGNNPMDLVKRKALPLDTEGVPEPLKGLIDRLTRPDPAARFQSAADLLRAIDLALSGAARTADPNATIIVPRLATRAGAPVAGPSPASATPATFPPVDASRADPSRPDPAPETLAPVAFPSQSLTPPPTSAPKPVIEPAKARGDGRTQAARPDSRPAMPTGKSSGGGAVVTGLVLALLGLLGAFAYLGGLLDQIIPARLPVADPYALIVERTEAGVVRAVGYMPSPETAEQLSQIMAGIGGTAELTLATGDIGPTWAQDVLAVIDQLKPVESWRLAVNSNQALVTGTTLDRARKDRLEAAFASGLPGGLTGSAKILLGPVILPVSVLGPLLTKAADCGPLRLLDPPAAGYPNHATITVSGTFAEPKSGAALQEAIAAVAGDRTVSLLTEVLNPPLCQIAAGLPDAPSGGFRFRFGFGDREGDNPSARYLVGENPVIDLTIPATAVDGYVSVLTVDVSGTVTHLLPNLNRPENSLAALRAGRDGPLSVRISYPLADNADPARIAFVVDPTSLGKSELLVIHSAEPLFANMRPTQESVGGLVEVLAKTGADGPAQILSIDSAIVISAAR